MLGTFPLEIYEAIVQHLHPSTDAPTLRATALTSPALLPASQKQLFAHIALYPTLSAASPRAATSARFKCVLTASPHIAAYVRNLELHLCADKTPWTGWSPALDYCLCALGCLRALAVRVDQSAPCFAGFSMRGPPGGAGAAAEGVVRALVRAVQLPSLVSLVAHGLDVSLLLAQGRKVNIRELTLSRPILRSSASSPPTSASAAELRSRNTAERDHVVYLDALRLETDESDNPDAPLIRSALLSQGVSLERLTRLSRVAHSHGGDGLFMKELWDILEGCGATLEELEIQTQLTAVELGALDWTKFKLPSLRVLHLHLYSKESASALAPHIPSFIASLLELCSPTPPNLSQTASSSSSSNPSRKNACSATGSRLERLILTDHDSSWVRGVDLGSIILRTLSDRRRFPRFERFCWDAGADTVEYYSDNEAFLDMKRGVPFEVKIRGIGRADSAEV